MRFCYQLLHDYGWAIVLFTLFSKVILFPLSLIVQKNSVKMVKIQPKIDVIKAMYPGDKDKIAEEQLKIYEEEHYSPLVGVVPMLLQIPLILGLINVIYNPLQHLLHLESGTITAFVEKTASLLSVSVEQLGSAPQLKVMELLSDPGQAVLFAGLKDAVADFDGVVARIQSIDLNFFGWNLSAVPQIGHPDGLWLIPLLSGVSALLLCVVQNAVNVLQREQGWLGRWGMTIFLVAFSAYFAFIVPAGVGVYWIAGNLMATGQMFLLNAVYDPKKYIDYSKRPPKPKPLTKEEKQEKAAVARAHKEKERSDYKRFFSEEGGRKELVFYSERSGFYKYFEDIMREVLSQSDLTIHYVTSDPEDAIFSLGNPRILPYYIGDTKLITFMMKLDVDMVVMTMPDLQNFHIKRSYVNPKVEYIYTEHGISSNNMMLRSGALDHYDTIFCVGPHQVEEYRQMEKLYGLPKRNLIEVGYTLMDNMSAAYEKQEKRENEKKTILIAPSWQLDNIMDSCLDEILEGLLGLGYRIVVRPHPQYVRVFSWKMEAILARYRDQLGEDFRIETDFSSNVTVYTADLVITDWSNIGYEFSFTTYKPTLYINTPMKVMNPDYEQLGIVPFDLRVRSQIGAEIELDRIDTVSETVKDLLMRTPEYREEIENLKRENFYEIGNSARVAAEYIVKRIGEIEEKRKEEESL
ncbi:MAG: membrane protein insertase YidC [Lachnospiraceae bacterium]|nr:membrane protein insertase YidC [Lachnospiraceae bacterium]